MLFATIDDDDNDDNDNALQVQGDRVDQLTMYMYSSYNNLGRHNKIKYSDSHSNYDSSNNSDGTNVQYVRGYYGSPRPRSHFTLRKRFQGGGEAFLSHGRPVLLILLLMLPHTQLCILQHGFGSSFSTVQLTMNIFLSM